MTTRSRRGRPTLKEQNIKRVHVRMTLTLYEGFDDDLIEWFNSIPDKKTPSYVKMALRQGSLTFVSNEEKEEEFIDDDFLDDLLASL